jgi:hypothetical protein
MRFTQVFKRRQGLLLQAPVLTITPCTSRSWPPSAYGSGVIQPRPEHQFPVIRLSRPFPSQLADVSIPLMYSLVLIPGINLVVPFLIFITLHILHNKSRRRHPGFWSSVEHPLRAIRSRISGTRTSDAESQNNSWLAGLGLPSTLLETRTSFLLVGLGCLVIELALARSKNPVSQEDDE